MKIWVYRPDKKEKDLDYTLLYYKGKTAYQYEQEKHNPIKTQVVQPIKSTLLEVPR